MLAESGYVIVGTLSGMCASINAQINVVAWRENLNSPIFASPALYNGDKYVIFAEVNGQIHCRTVVDGVKVKIENILFLQEGRLKKLASTMEL